MQKQGILHQQALLNLFTKAKGNIDIGNPMVSGNLSLNRRSIINSCCLKGVMKEISILKLSKIESLPKDNVELYDEDDEGLCPVDCVKEFMTDEEFRNILEKAKETNALVVVDFYRTSCGSCKYIEQGFIKLCKGSGEEQAPVIFLKHNVLDEYDEQSEVAERLRIRSVPLFHFYKNGILLESFATRDKERVLSTILKYTSSASQEVESIL